MIGHCPFVIIMILTSFIFYFAKAFDSVSHTKLVHKLQAYGITGRLLKLLSDFLSNHCWLGNLGHHTCNKKAVLPQGNRAMPQVFFSVEVRQQHSLQV